jgi:hypothetical protein
MDSASITTWSGPIRSMVTASTCAAISAAVFAPSRRHSSAFDGPQGVTLA